MTQEPLPFGIVGTGWRAAFFLRVAAACPERFRVTGLMARPSARATTISETFNLPLVATLEQLVSTKPQFVVTAVPPLVNGDLVRECVALDLPVLSETPPASTIESLTALWQATGRSARPQVAEQYVAQPHHAARLRFVADGYLGRITQAHISIAYGYHGISLMRRFLDIGHDDVEITAQRFRSPLVEGPGRAGGPVTEDVKLSAQDIALFNYGDRLGVFDFADDQYFSWIRRQRLLVRGERGELVDHAATYLKDFQTPIHVDFLRHEAGANGNLEGNYLKGVQAGENWVYRNPLAPATLSDDEIAVGTCLLHMGNYVRTSVPFYSLADACQDTYLALMVERAIQEGRPVTTTRQVWSTL